MTIRAFTSRSGSTLIVVLLIMSALTIGMTNIWFSAVFARAIVYKHALSEQRYYATQALIAYGITLIKTHADSIREQQAIDGRPFEIIHTPWPTLDAPYSGKLVITARADEYVLHAHLLDAGTIVSQLRCTLIKKESDTMIRYLIRDWSV